MSASLEIVIRAEAQAHRLGFTESAISRRLIPGDHRLLKDLRRGRKLRPGTRKAIMERLEQMEKAPR